MRHATLFRPFPQFAAALLVVCTLRAEAAGSQNPDTPGRTEVHSGEVLRDAASNFTVFPFPSSWRDAGDEPWADSADSNTWVGWKDALWFPVYNVKGSASPSSLARVSLDGTFSLIPFNQGQGYVSRIGLGPDTALWFAGSNLGGSPRSQWVGRFSPAGLVDKALPIAREAAIPTSGADGALWYGAPSSGLPEDSGSYIGRTTLEGANSLFKIPNLTGSAIAGIFECYPGELAAGSDGQIWFPEFCWNFWSSYPGPWSAGTSISSISSTGVFTRYPVRAPSGDHSLHRGLSDPVTGPDGALWMGLRIGSYSSGEERSGLARITTTGVYTEHLLPASPCIRSGGGVPAGIYSGTRNVRNLVVGLDGALWFTENVFVDERCISYESRLGRYDLATGELTEFLVPGDNYYSALGLTQGPDGALWLLMRTNLDDGRRYSVIRFSPPGLKVVVTADRTTVPATGLVTARAVVTNTTTVTTAPGRLTLTEGEGAMYAHKGDTDNGTFGTVAGLQNVVYFDMGAFAPGEQKTFEVPLMIVPLIDAANVKVTAEFSVGADGTFGEAKTLEITATPITAVQDASTFADLIALPVADLGTSPDGTPRDVASVETLYPSDLGDMWSLYITESLSRWSRKDKSLYFTLKKAGFSSRSAYAAVYMRALMDLKPSGSCIPSGSEMAKASAKMWWAVQQARWFKGKETSFYDAFVNVANGLGGCSALYPMNIIEFHDKYTAPLVKSMSDSFARFALTYANVELQVCNYLTNDTRMTVPLPRLVEADIDYRLAKGVYHPTLHNKILAQVDIRNGSGGTMLLGSAIYQILEQGASQCDMVQAKLRRGKAVSIQVHSPLMPVVTDALGRKSGVDAQARVVYDEIPGAMMAPGHPWSIHLPSSGAPFQVAWTTAYGGAFGIDVQGQTNGVTTSTQSFASTAIKGFSSNQTINVTLNAGRVIASATTGSLNRATSATTLAATPAAVASLGQTVTFVASVTASGSPSGTVTFTDGPTLLGTVNLLGGEARYSTSSLTAGAHSVTATYSGDGTFAGSTSAALTQIVPARLSIGDAKVIEGNSGTTRAAFTATLTPASSSLVTASWATTDGTANATDYVPATGTITFFPGETSKSISVSVFGDTTVESNEGFGLSLSSAVAATIARPFGQGNIQNDDASTAVSRPQASWQEFFAVDTLETPYAGDFNGDRRVDIITFTRQNPNAIGDVYVSLSDGVKFGANAKWHDFFAISTDESVIIGDFNGDGKDDIATWLGKASRQVYVALSTGSGMLTESAWVTSIGTDATDLIFAGDANGDGKDDLIAFARKQGKVYVAISDGTKFATPAVWHGFFAVSTYERPRVADVNGDGKADIVTFATDSPTAFGDVYVATSDGTQFVGPTGAPNDSSKWHDFFAIRPTEEIRIGDLNGDGKDDFFTFLPPPFAQAYSVLSQGTSMADNALWAEAVAPLLGAGDNVYVGDVNGDGKADIIIFAQKEGKVFVSLAP